MPHPLSVAHIAMKESIQLSTRVQERNDYIDQADRELHLED